MLHPGTCLVLSYWWQSWAEMAAAVPFLTPLSVWGFFFWLVGWFVGFNHDQSERLYVSGSVKCFYHSSSQTYFVEMFVTEKNLI